MKVVPISITAARDFVSRHHRHNNPPRSALFALGLSAEGVLVGVATVGRPIARMLQDGLTAEVTRVCTIPEAPKGAVSKLYARCQKVWFAMGGLRLITYTLESEKPGGPWFCQI